MQGRDGCVLHISMQAGALLGLRLSGRVARVGGAWGSALVACAFSTQAASRRHLVFAGPGGVQVCGAVGALGGSLGVAVRGSDVSPGGSRGSRGVGASDDAP